MSKSRNLICAALAAAIVLCITLVPSCSKSPDSQPPKAPPAENLFVVQVNNFEYTLSQIDQFLLGVSPIPMGLQMVVRMQLAGVLGSPDLAGLNMQGSFTVFGVLLPAESPQAEPTSRVFVAGLVSVSDYDKFVSGNSNCSEPDKNGISTIKIGTPAPPPVPGQTQSPAVRAPGPKVLAAKLGGYALVCWGNDYDKLLQYKKLMTGRTGAAAQLAGIADSALAQQAAKEPIWACGNVQAASNTFGPLILEKLDEMKGMLTQINPEGQGQMMNPAAIMDMYAGILETIMKEIKSFTVAIKPSPKVLHITETVSAVPGTDAADMLAADATARQKNELLGYLEDGVAMNFAMQMNAPFWQKLTVKGMDLLGALGGQSVSPDDIAKMTKLMADSMDSMGGSVAGAFSVDATAKPPFAIKYVVAVKDADKFNKMLDESVEMFNTTGIKDLYKGLGIEMDYTMKRNADTYKDVSIDSARLVMKSTEPNSPPGKMIDTMYGGGFDYRWGVVDGLCTIAIGGDVDSVVRELIDQVKAGGAKELCNEVKEALELLPQADKADFFVTYNYVRLLNMVGGFMQAIPGAGAQMPQIDVPTKSNLAIAGKIGDGNLVVDIAVPKQHLSEIVAAFMILQQHMQAQMNVTRTKTNLKMLHSAVSQFKMDTGRYPTEEEGLMALVKKPADVEGWEQGGYLETPYMPKDAWNREFVYELDPASGKPFVIISYGADGKEGGENLNTDLFSTDPD